MQSTEEILAALWCGAGEAPDALGRVRIEGDEFVLPGVFRVAAALESRDPWYATPDSRPAL